MAELDKVLSRLQAEEGRLTEIITLFGLTCSKLRRIEQDMRYSQLRVNILSSGEPPQ